MDIQKYINQAVQQGPDMSKAQTSSGGGSGYTPPPEGPVLLRFVGYIEIGQVLDEYQGERRIKDKVKLIFECHGKNYPNNDRITITENLSLHEKSNFQKIFQAMRAGDDSIRHMSQLLGGAFRGRVYHHSFTGRDGNKRVFARLRDKNGYSIGPSVAEDPETGEVRAIQVPEPKTPLKIFLWNFATKEMWDNLFIEGEYSDGRSKNLLQNEILEAYNFKGSPIDNILNGGEAISREFEQMDTSPKQGGAFRPQGVNRPAGRPQPMQHSDPFDDEVPM